MLIISRSEHGLRALRARGIDMSSAVDRERENYIVFDDKGVIHSSTSEEDAQREFEITEDFEGDLVFCKELARRR